MDSLALIAAKRQQAAFANEIAKFRADLLKEFERLNQFDELLSALSGEIAREGSETRQELVTILKTVSDAIGKIKIPEFPEFPEIPQPDLQPLFDIALAQAKAMDQLISTSKELLEKEYTIDMPVEERPKEWKFKVVRSPSGFDVTAKAV